MGSHSTSMMIQRDGETGIAVLMVILKGELTKDAERVIHDMARTGGMMNVDQWSNANLWIRRPVMAERETPDEPTVSICVLPSISLLNSMARDNC